MVILSRDDNFDVIVEELKVALNKNEKQEIVINEKYMSWLEEFTNSNSEINTKNLEEREDVSLNEKVYITKLSLLFSMVENYANENFIFPKGDENKIIYVIMHNGIFYEIGKFVSNEFFYFCNRYSSRERFVIIPFKNVLNNVKMLRTEIIENRFEKAFESIKKIEDADIPLEFILKFIKNMHNN